MFIVSGRIFPVREFDFGARRVARTQTFARCDRSNAVRRGVCEFQCEYVLTHLDATVVV